MPCSYYHDEPDDTKTIEVKKGSPANSRYAIFYKVKQDPVIFCKNWGRVRKELKRLKKRKDVDQKSIRVFRQVNV